MLIPTMRTDGFTAFAASAMPGNQPAARERHDQRLDLGLPIEDLERDRALPGHDVEMVEGRNFGQALLLHQPVGLLLGVVLGAADAAHLGAKLLDRPHLRLRNQVRQADDRAYAHARRDRRHGPPVIAGRAADDAARLALVGKAGDGVCRTADLEGADRLETLELQHDVVTPRADGISGVSMA